MRNDDELPAGEDREPFWYDNDGLETTFVENMKMLRERRGLSQTEFARQARERGLPFHQPTVQRIERGERPIKLGEAIAVAGLLNSSLEVMMKDFSLPFAYEHLRQCIVEVWQGTQPDDQQSSPHLRSLNWHINELKDAIEDYKMALGRFDSEPQVDIIDFAKALADRVAIGITHITEGERKAAECWAGAPNPNDVLPEVHHAATPFAERQMNEAVSGIIS